MRSISSSVVAEFSSNSGPVSSSSSGDLSCRRSRLAAAFACFDRSRSRLFEVVRRVAISSPHPAARAQDPPARARKMIENVVSRSWKDGGGRPRSPTRLLLQPRRSAREFPDRAVGRSPAARRSRAGRDRERPGQDGDARSPAVRSSHRRRRAAPARPGRDADRRRRPGRGAGRRRRTAGRGRRARSRRRGAAPERSRRDHGDVRRLAGRGGVRARQPSLAGAPSGAHVLEATRPGARCSRDGRAPTALRTRRRTTPTSRS